MDACAKLDGMSKLRLIAQLDVSAASGVVVLEERLYVLADDQLDLAVYDLSGLRTGSVALIPGQLPAEYAARKAAKPDFEALVVLPDHSVLVLGSGSTPQRRRGVRLQLSAADPQISMVDLSPLYTALDAELPELNIEGCAVLGSSLYLCSRGNGSRHDNVLVQLDLTRALEALQHTQALNGDCIVALHRVQLGELAGVPLSLTDLALHDSSLIFSAAAEASANTYDDGACAGSVIGKLTPTGQPSEVMTITTELKIEGICSASTHGLYAVADADDPSKGAPLLAIDPWPRAT
jgi:hypothetical protein